MEIDRHAHVLFQAIAMTLACGAETKPPPTEIVVPSAASNTAPVATTPVATTPVASAPVATATASAAPDNTVAVLGPMKPQPSASVPKPKAVPRKVRVMDVEGRPFIVDGTARLAPTMRGDGWADEVSVLCEAKDRPALIEHYTQWALAEHASIASFARFTLQLMALGAPSDLVAQATDAMRDEVRHARFGFGLVQALSGNPIAPSKLPIDRALDEEATLENVLRLVIREGMIGETLAALEVRVAAELATDRSLSAVLSAIADDESRHAELAWSFGRWALAQKPSLAAILEEELRAFKPPALPDVRGLDRFGILDASRRKDVRETGWATVVTPLTETLLSG